MRLLCLLRALTCFAAAATAVPVLLKAVNLLLPTSEQDALQVCDLCSLPLDGVLTQPTCPHTLHQALKSQRHC